MTVQTMEITACVLFVAMPILVISGITWALKLARISAKRDEQLAKVKALSQPPTPRVIDPVISTHQHLEYISDGKSEWMPCFRKNCKG